MVKIISDSTCDLSPELVARYDIDVLPLHIVLGEEDFDDLSEAMIEKYAALLRTPQALVRTPMGVIAIPMDAESAE